MGLPRVAKPGADRVIEVTSNLEYEFRMSMIFYTNNSNSDCGKAVSEGEDDSFS